jgi:outer membrane protein assembly factor BamB
MSTLVRRVALFAVAPLLLSGCWLDVGGNALHTGFNATDTAIRSDTFAGLHEVWSAAVSPSDSVRLPSSVAVFGGTLFIEADNGDLQAYDADGNTNCSGTPTSCQPLWTASGGGQPTTIAQTDPATDGATVFVGGADGKLYAFDAAGQTNCSGTPKKCTPLWTASLGSAAFDPVVANGRVFIGSTAGDLFAFDAAGGDTNCGGTPRTCQPLWKATTGASYGSIGNLPAPAVSNSAVYYPSGSGLDVFDPAGQSNCGGSPRVCRPLWSASFASSTPTGWPVVGGDIVYLPLETNNVGNIVALDAAGKRGCSGTPTVCAPLWTDDAHANSTVTPAYGPDGLLYAGFSGLDVFSTDGTTGCSGSPVVCQPLHSASIPGLTLAPTLTGDAVVLGVFALSGPGDLMGFKQGTLDPLGSFSIGTSPPTIFPGLLAIANGTIYEATNDGHLEAWAP